MSRTSGFNNVFNAGELAPDLWSRSDLQQHAHGCALAQNFIGQVGGSLAKAPGFWDAGAAISSADDRPSWLIPFRKSRQDALMLEFGHQVMRVWTGDYQPVLSSGSPLEVVSPFTQAQLAGLRYEQSNDVLYLFNADPSVRPYSLSRSSNTSWAFTQIEFEDGPWLPENATTTTITPTGSGGNLAGATVDLAASAGIFAADMVGGLFKLRNPAGATGVDAWVGNYEPTGGYNVAYPLNCRQSNGRVYKFVLTNDGLTGSATKTGSNPPVHDQGIQWDGLIWWQFLHDGAGIVKITSYTSPTQVTGTVIRTLPMVLGKATPSWSEGAYSTYRGWPTACPIIHDERLISGANKARPDILDGTRTAGFVPTKLDMKPGLGTGAVVDDDAVRKSAGGGGRRIVWLAKTSALIAGTTVGEVLLTGPDGTDPLVPASRPGQQVSDFGSADAMPAQAQGSILFIEKSGATLATFGVSPDSTLTASDQSVTSEHIGSRGMVQIAWAGRPDNICWVRLADGGLASFTWHKEMEVKGWSTRKLGSSNWTVESIATLPAYGSRDALWCVASRIKNGQRQRRIMVVSQRKDAMRLDAARLYSGAPANTIGGLTHFANEAITLMAGDGQGGWAEYRNITVNGLGQASLPDGMTAPLIYAGEPMTARFESLPLDLSGAGSTQGRRQRLTGAEVVFRGVRFRKAALYDDVQDGAWDPVEVPRLSSQTAYRKPRRFVEKITFGGGSDRDPRYVIEDSSAFDLTIYAIRPVADVN